MIKLYHAFTRFQQLFSRCKHLLTSVLERGIIGAPVAFTPQFLVVTFSRLESRSETLRQRLRNMQIVSSFTPCNQRLFLRPAPARRCNPKSKEWDKVDTIAVLAIAIVYANPQCATLKDNSCFHVSVPSTRCKNTIIIIGIIAKMHTRVIDSRAIIMPAPTHHMHPQHNAPCS